ncbi:MAG: alpha/beta hydrolase, partial [Thermoplasmatota archaeon]
MKKKFKTLSLFFLLLLLLCNTTQASLEKNAEQDSASQTTHHFYMIQINGPLPPDQPSTGPGGSNYSHFGVRKSRYGFGGQRFWIFEPFGPKPESAPVIVFLHGFTAINPFIYREWIYHLVQRGNIVIYPRYQQWILRGSADYHPNAVNAVKQAITILQDGGHVQPELEKFAITGHSLGGGLTVSLAAVAEQQGLPIPKAIMPVQPFLYRIDEVNLSDICSETLMLVVVGEDDTIVGNQSGKII